MSVEAREPPLSYFLEQVVRFLRRVNFQDKQLWSIWLNAFVESVHCTSSDALTRSSVQSIRETKAVGCTLENTIKLVTTYVEAVATVANPTSNGDGAIVRMTIETKMWSAFLSANRQVGLFNHESAEAEQTFPKSTRRRKAASPKASPSDEC